MPLLRRLAAITQGGTGQTTATAAFDALAPTTTQGDMIYHNGTDNVRLAKGTASQEIRMNAGATAPEWFTPTAGSPTWEKLVEVTLGANTATISSGTFAARKNLMVFVHIVGMSVASTPQIRVNGVSTGTPYSNKYSDNLAALTSNVSQNQISITGTGITNSGLLTFEITNRAASNKSIHGRYTIPGSTSANAPTVAQFDGVWYQTTDQVTSIEIVNPDSATFTTGSWITVYGSND